MVAVRFGQAFVPCWTRRGSAVSHLAIATTTSRDNIDVLLAASLGEDWAQWFTAIVAGDEVPRKKPAPDVYLKVLSQLDLPASQCLAIEDSGIGLAAASGAGIPVLSILLLSIHAFHLYCEKAPATWSGIIRSWTKTA